MTLTEFIAQHKVSMTCTRIARNPNMDSTTRMKHWRCVLRANGRSMMTVPFSMGLGLTGEPTAEDVLDCLASDAGSVEAAPIFSDWADDLSYDSDSRKAERTFKNIQRQADELAKFLGAEAYDTLLFKTERL